MHIRLKKGYLFLVVGLLPLSLTAQNSLQYPVIYSQYFNYYSFLNPGASGEDPGFVIKAGNVFNTGFYSRIRNIFAMAEYGTAQKERSVRHGFTAVFLSNQEGNLLSLTRTYFQYGLHVRLSEEWKFSSGISAGFLNFNAEQTTSSGSISSFIYDGGLGIWLKGKRDRFGISSSQIFNNSFRVINERIPINRYYRFIYTRNQELSDHFIFVPSLLFTLRNVYSDFDVNTNFLLNNLVLLGAGYRYKKGSAMFFGIKDLDLAGIKSSATFSYNIPWPAKDVATVQSFELVLSAFFK